MQIDGEASFSVPLDHIKSAQSNLEGYALLVEANVTESLNSITLGGTSTVDMYDNAVKLEFLSSNPETFKPGLDYIAYVRIRLCPFYLKCSYVEFVCHTLTLEIEGTLIKVKSFDSNCNIFSDILLLIFTL